MADRHVPAAVMMTRGRELPSTQASSLLVSAGEASVAVRPEARVPSTAVAKGRQLGSWMRTMGAI